MILISNHCHGGFSYQGLKLPYNNPFIWSYTPVESLLSFIEHWYSINWHNIKIHKSNETERFNTYFRDKSLLDTTFYIEVDNVGVIEYPHFRLDDKYETPTKVNYADIHYKYAYKYVIDTYMRRVNRMCALHEYPIVYYLAVNANEVSYANKIETATRAQNMKCIGLDCTATHNLEISTKFESSICYPDPDLTKKASEEAIPWLNDYVNRNA